MSYQSYQSSKISESLSDLDGISTNSATSPLMYQPTQLTTHQTTQPSSNYIQNKTEQIFDNPYVKAVLYIILILYASVIAPKLPNWIMPYLEEPIVKIIIVLIIGLLATKDPTAAIIATIGVTITYLFIKDAQNTNSIKDINEKEEKEKEKEKAKEKANIPVKKSTEQCNMEKFYIKKNSFVPNVEHFNTNNIKYNAPNPNVEHFNTNNTSTIHNIEYFDVLKNNNNTNYINHIEEYFNTK